LQNLINLQSKVSNTIADKVAKVMPFKAFIKTLIGSFIGVATLLAGIDASS
jgi:hypothetical protein